MKEGETNFLCNQCGKTRTILSCEKREVACKCCGILYCMTINRRVLGEVVRTPAKVGSHATILLSGKNQRPARIICRLKDYNNNGLGLTSIPLWAQKKLKVGGELTLEFSLAYNDSHTDTLTVCWMENGRAGLKYLRPKLKPWQRVHQHCQEKSF